MTSSLLQYRVSQELGIQSNFDYLGIFCKMECLFFLGKQNRATQPTKAASEFDEAFAQLCDPFLPSEVMQL